MSTTEKKSAVRTVKISQKTAKRLKVAAGILDCTQQEVVEKALDAYWPEVKKKVREIV